LNSVVNGIHALPSQFTGGEGAVTGQEVRINVTFNTPFVLGPDHVFFRPEVDLGNAPATSSGSPRPGRSADRGPHRSGPTSKAGSATTGRERWGPTGSGSAPTSPIRARSTPPSR